MARGRIRHGAGPAEAGCIPVLAPAELGSITPDRPPAAVVVAGGAPLSHPLIRLLGLGIPTVILTSGAAASLPEGACLAVDGGSGRIGEPEAIPEAEPPPGAGGPVAMADGSPVALRASVSDAGGAAWARVRGAEAVGLVRSEYLCPRGVRFLDLAPDKAPPWLGHPDGFAGTLGRHGSRLFDADPARSAFLAEAGAVAELAERLPLGVLVPYLTEVAEFRRWREVLAGVLPETVPVGAMLETPAAVQEVAAFQECADSVGIGCNDLMQAFFAADRDVPEVAALLNPYSPVIFRFLARAVEAAGTGAARLMLCGLLPQMPGLLPVLLGMGFRTFSVEPALLPYLARAVASTEPAAARRLAAEVVAAREPGEVQEALGLPPGSPWAS
jgi:phosphoenolpyruvate-protein kinase (PTS system EI component)